MGYKLFGCYDLHIHSAPDVIPRKLTDLQLAERAEAAGMSGIAIKSHAFPTAGRAAAVKKLHPRLDVIGGITLNRTVGGINPCAVEASAKMGAKMLWFPTIDAKAYRKQGEESEQSKALSALDDHGKLSQQTIEVLSLAKEYDLVVGTGHLGTQESMLLAEVGARMGLRRMCMTHVTLPVCKMTVEQARECIRWGAMVEYSYCHLLSGKCSVEYVAEQIKTLGCEHIILTTDLGQSDNPEPLEGLQNFCDLLIRYGISEQWLNQMLKDNPWKLLYGT